MASVVIGIVLTRSNIRIEPSGELCEQENETAGSKKVVISRPTELLSVSQAGLLRGISYLIKV
jgi:hypothetical protein